MQFSPQAGQGWEPHARTLSRPSSSTSSWCVVQQGDSLRRFRESVSHGCRVGHRHCNCSGHVPTQPPMTSGLLTRSREEANLQFGMNPPRVIGIQETFGSFRATRSFGRPSRRCHRTFSLECLGTDRGKVRTAQACPFSGASLFSPSSCSCSNAGTACSQRDLGFQPDHGPGTIAAQLHAAFWSPPWVPTLDVDPYHRARSDRGSLGLGLGLGLVSVEIASAKPPPSSEQSCDGCRVYQVTPRKTPRADRLIVGIDRPPDGPKCPRASSQVQQARCTITLSARPSLAFVSQGHGSPAAPRRAVRNLDDGWDDLSRPRKKPPRKQ